MKKFILDSSVLVKLFTKEVGHEKSMKILEFYLKGNVQIFSLQLAIWEVLNALKYNPSFPQSEIKKVGVTLITYGFEFFGMDEKLAELTIDYALKFDITIYDASYIALARILNCQLITADKKLFKVVKSLKFVKLL